MNNMYHFLDQPNIVQVSLYNFKKVLIKYLCNKALLPSSKKILTVFVSRPQDIRNRYFQVLFLPFFFIIVQSHWSIYSKKTKFAELDVANWKIIEIKIFQKNFETKLIWAQSHDEFNKNCCLWKLIITIEVVRIFPYLQN